MPIFKTAELVISAPDKNSWPQSDFPEVVLAGRSNVGKSSFINTLTGRKKLAYVGNTPGKTRLLNFFCLDNMYMFVDVPGYGYAKIPKKQLIQFGQMMEDYFYERAQKRGVIIIVDARHQPTVDDITMVEYARYFNIPVAIVATKMDKLKKSERKRNIQRIQTTLQLSEDERVYPFSAETKEGVEEVWIAIQRMFQSEKAEEKN